VPDLPNVVIWSIPAFVLLTLFEAISFRLHPNDDEVGYAAKDTATSLSMGLGSLAFDALWGIVPGLVYAATYAATPLRVPIVWPALLLCLLAQDFCY
jgi:hypothetical protein